MNKTNSNTLFHFTNYEALKKILLTKKFKININKVEWLGQGDKGYTFKIPMVCFTETPFEFLQNHIRSFGEYGLGMKIEWAVNLGMHNVIYTDNLSNNKFSTFVTDLLSKYYSTPVANRYEKKLNDILVGSTELMKYRDEREWRYIAEINDYKKYSFCPEFIEFTFSDINFLSIPETERSEVLNFLEINDFYDLIEKVI